MQLLRTNADLAAWRERATNVIFVPTMGALHDGHRALIRRAADQGECLVSIFVNPAQFNDPADYETYPDTLDDDLAMCAEDGAAGVYAPTVEQVYPPGERLHQPAIPDVARLPRLEDAARPGHFEGVCRVLHRLFTLCRPHAAIFGEKDFQQLQVTRALVEQERLDIDIQGAPIVRDFEGLALSSRNRRLSPNDRARALTIPRALKAASACTTPVGAEAAMRSHLESAGINVSYAVVRDARSLLAPGPSGPWRSLIAGAVGGVHLLDNAPWPGP